MRFSIHFMWKITQSSCFATRCRKKQQLDAEETVVDYQCIKMVKSEQSFDKPSGK